MSYKKTVERILQKAGVGIDGKHDYDIEVKNKKLYKRVLQGGSIELGESYMDGWWDVSELDKFFDRTLSAELEKDIKSWKTIPYILSAVLFNFGSKARAFNIGKAHYDIGNDLYERMLDKRMVYTCAYWKDANNLDDAQDAKLDLVCKKIGLKKGQKVLDIGCGWGSFAKFAAEKYGVKVVGVTVSKEQVKLGKKLCQGLPVELRLQDYRDVKEKFDHVVSLGMFEHVGYKNYRTYMEVVNKVLKDDGLFLLHTIGKNNSAFTTDPWIDKYIFPGSILPSVKKISESIENLFVMEDWHNFGTDYDKTLMAWYDNFEDSWSEISDKYDERFYRMWKYYLLSCAGSFRARRNQLWQIVLSKNGVKSGYQSVR